MVLLGPAKIATHNASTLASPVEWQCASGQCPGIAACVPQLDDAAAKQVELMRVGASHEQLQAQSVRKHQGPATVPSPPSPPPHFHTRITTQLLPQVHTCTVSFVAADGFTCPSSS